MEENEKENLEEKEVVTEENTKTEEIKKNSKKNEIMEWINCILIAVIIAFLIRYFIFTLTIVKQVSMYPTLVENDKLVIERTHVITGATPKYGDIITFEAPSDISIDSNSQVAYYEPQSGVGSKALNYFTRRFYIKRVIGLPGDTIKLENGRVYRNNKLLDEPYVHGQSTMAQDKNSNVVVPKGSLFVMGDNRERSRDSRSFGCIPLEKIEGKAVFRVMPVNKFGEIKY